MHTSAPDPLQSSTPTEARPRPLTTALILAALAAAAVIIGAPGITTGGLGWSDAPLHAMDGVFIHDLDTNRSAEPLRRWAEEFYLRYPCLGIVVYYPPLYAVIEAVAYAVFGISVATARATVLVFVIAAVWALYALARRRLSPAASAAACLLALASPAGVAWSRDVMLEWPATLFVLLTLLAYTRYLDRPTWLRGGLVGCCCLAAYLTKQTAAFVLPVIVLHAALSARRCELLRPRLLVPLAAAALAIAAYSFAIRKYTALPSQLVLGNPPLAHLLSLSTWTWYLSRLPSIAGWPLLITFIAGVLGLACTQPETTLDAASPERERGDLWRCSLALGASKDIPIALMALMLWWLISTAIEAKEERYFFFAVPLMALVAAAGAVRARSARRSLGEGGSEITWSIALTALLIMAAVAQFTLALLSPAAILPNMKPTVEFLAARPDCDLVLVDSVRDGQFVFDLRTTPAARDRIIPLRASKFLYSRAARTRYGYQAHISTPEELRAWLDRYGVRYIVYDTAPPRTSDPSWDPLPRAMLRELMKDPRDFELLHTQPLSAAGGDSTWDNISLAVVRYKHAPPRTSDTVRIPVPAMGLDVTIPLPRK